MKGKCMAIEKESSPGDILVVERRDKLYFHYAVYGKRIIHYIHTGRLGEHIYIHEAPLKELPMTFPLSKFARSRRQYITDTICIARKKPWKELGRGREEKYDCFQQL
ncbi:MAG: hypothetical protein ACLUIQ_01405 [Dialister invisus]